MNKKSIFLGIISIVGLISFFLPWLWLFGDQSGFTLVIRGIENEIFELLYLSIFPICFIFSIYFRFFKINSENDSIFKLIEKIPFFAIIIAMFYLVELVNPPKPNLINSSVIEEIFKVLFKIFKVGFGLTFLSSFLLFFIAIFNRKTIDLIEETIASFADFIKELIIAIFTVLKVIYNYFIKRPLHFLIFIIVLTSLFGLYLFFIKDYPVKDAKKIAENICECSENYIVEASSVYDKFNEKSPLNVYEKRKDAFNSLNKKISPIRNEFNDCEKKVKNELDKLLSMYSRKRNSKQLVKFESTYMSEKRSCRSIFSDNALNSKKNNVEYKIRKIIDPLPDFDKLKQDLIGRKLVGNFQIKDRNHLNEFDVTLINQKNQPNNKSEFIISIETLFPKESERYAEIQCKIEYILNDYTGWQLYDVERIYYQSNHIIPHNEWKKISIIDNNFRFNNNHNLAWRTSNSIISKTTKTGPLNRNVKAPFSQSKNYWINSLDNRNVLLRISYGEKISRGNLNKQLSDNKIVINKKELIGFYVGSFDHKEIEITINNIENGVINGINKVDQNERTIFGNYEVKNNKVIAVLNEPGNHEWDGIFHITFTINKNNTVHGVGNWKSNNGKLNRHLSITKQIEKSEPITNVFGQYPFASQRMLNDNDLKSLNKNQLQIMRNEIFARHGYIFQTDKMKKHFTNKSWYKPQLNSVDHLLTEIEKENIKLIQKYE